VGKVTGIEYVDHTQNFWYGCSKVSAGCKNCYAEREMKRFGRDFDKVQRSKTTFNDPLKWKEPARVLACSWGDFFHEDVPITWLDDAWEIIRNTPHLTYMLLTKRAHQINLCLPDDWGEGYPNVWLGVTVEHDDEMWRLVSLEDVKAIVRFVSAEPLLGPLDFYSFSPSLDWVIVGGESGPNCRPMNPEWAVDIRDQCVKAGMAFFFKQHGGKTKIDGAWGGKLLEGQEWSEMPNDQ